MKKTIDSDGVSRQMQILQERLWALGTLLRYEMNPENAKFYQRELDRVAEAYDKAKLLLRFNQKQSQSKVLAFRLGKSGRSA